MYPVHFPRSQPYSIISDMFWESEKSKRHHIIEFANEFKRATTFSGNYASQGILNFTLINQRNEPHNMLSYCNGNISFLSYDCEDRYLVSKSRQAIYIPMDDLFRQKLPWRTVLKTLHEVGHFEYGFNDDPRTINVLRKLNMNPMDFLRNLQQGEELEEYKIYLEEEKFAWLYAIREFRRLASGGFVEDIQLNKIIKTSNLQFETYLPPILESSEEYYLISEYDI